MGTVKFALYSPLAFVAFAVFTHGSSAAGEASKTRVLTLRAPLPLHASAQSESRVIATVPALTRIKEVGRGGNLYVVALNKKHAQGYALFEDFIRAVTPYSQEEGDATDDGENPDSSLSLTLADVSLSSTVESFKCSSEYGLPREGYHSCTVKMAVTAAVAGDRSVDVDVTCYADVAFKHDRDEFLAHEASWEKVTTIKVEGGTGSAEVDVSVDTPALLEKLYYAKLADKSCHVDMISASDE